MTTLAPLLLLDLSGALLHGVVAAVFGLLGIVCIVVTVIGLPGGWLLLLLACLVQFADRWMREEGDHTFGTWTLVGAAVLLLGGEVLEFAAGAAGAKRAGASKRGMVGATIGGIVGAIAGSFVIVVIGTILGGVVGSALGAILMELTLPHQTLASSLEPATGAAIGRLKGLLGKLVITGLVWAVLTVAAFVP